RELHAGGQLVTADAALQGIIGSTLRQVLAIELRQGGEAGGLCWLIDGGGGIQISHRGAARVQCDALRSRGKKAAGPVVRGSRGERAAVGNDHERRQVIDLAAAAVGNPSPGGGEPQRAKTAVGLIGRR